jgi:hypothetical protein
VGCATLNDAFFEPRRLDCLVARKLVSCTAVVRNSSSNSTVVDFPYPRTDWETLENLAVGSDPGWAYVAAVASMMVAVEHPHSGKAWAERVARTLSWRRDWKRVVDWQRAVAKEVAPSARSKADLKGDYRRFRLIVAWTGVESSRRGGKAASAVSGRMVKFGRLSSIGMCDRSFDR